MKEDFNKWKKYVDQDWYLEDKEIYDEELLEVAENLKCNINEVYIVTSEDECEYVDNLVKGDHHGPFLFTYNTCEIYCTYDSGLTCLFTKF